MKFQSLKSWLKEEVAKGKKFIDNQVRDTYGCVMMESTIDNWDEYHIAGIDKEDVHIKPHDDSYGLETQPHVTVLYGIHEDEIDPETIAEVIKQNLKPLTLKVEEVDIFEGEEYDVVKYNLPVTEQLQEYRDLFLKFPNTQSYPDYHPHMTIAYVKPGKGKKYKRKLRDAFEVTFTKGVYSYHDNPEDPNDFKRKVINLEEDDDPLKLKENLNESSNRLQIYKNKDGSYDATQNSELYHYSWKSETSKIYGFKKIGTINKNYTISGKLVSKPPMQMILQVQENIKK